jgi:hypothetical protein
MASNVTKNYIIERIYEKEQFHIMQLEVCRYMRTRVIMLKNSST